MAINSWPESERPREKLIKQGPSALSDAELLAIFLRTGTAGSSAVDLARELLQRFGLPREIPAGLEAGRILDAMKLDKKVLAGSIRLILVRAAGRGIIDDRSDAQQIRDAIEACKAS